MALETVAHIADLNVNNPTGEDPKGQGDDHIRNLKIALLADLPNITGPVTASQAEINILDGALVTTAELNILDGATLSTTELNILDGATVTAAELNVLDGVIVSTAELNALDGITVGSGDLNKTAQITSGPFAPAITPLTNITGSPVDGGFIYSRVLNVVTVTGTLTVQPTASGNNTNMRIALPVASDFSAGGNAAGSGTYRGSGAPVAVEIAADPTNNALFINFLANTSAPGTGTLTFTAQYFVQ